MQHRQREERQDRRAALAAWLLANINRDTKQRYEPFTLEEITAWLGYSGSYVRQPDVQAAGTPATPEELQQRLQTVYLLHQAMQGQNGQIRDGQG